MPTFEARDRFWREFAALNPQQKLAFQNARKQLVYDLEHHRSFRHNLRVKPVQGAGKVLEMTWARDGRATFHYGSTQVAGQPHIVWRRIGTHAIFLQP